MIVFLSFIVVVFPAHFLMASKSYAETKPVEPQKPVCFSTFEDMEKYKARLPKTMQSLPAVYRTTSALVHPTGFSLSRVDGGSQLKVRQVVAATENQPKSDTDYYVKSICVTDLQVKLTFETGMGIDLKRDGDNLVYGTAVVFSPTDQKLALEKILYPSTRAGTTIPYEIRNSSQ